MHLHVCLHVAPPGGEFVAGPAGEAAVAVLHYQPVQQVVVVLHNSLLSVHG